jgi:hypothetical protein
LKTFHVYLHPARGYESVPEGPCLPALCFSVFWLVFRGLAVPASVVLLGAALLVGAELTAGRNAVDEIQSWSFRLLMVAAVLALWLMPFLQGNRWRHADLLRRGFAEIACLRALSGDDAIARALSLDTLAAAPLGTAPSAHAAHSIHEARTRAEGAGPPAAASDPSTGRSSRRERRVPSSGAEGKARSLQTGAGPAGETVLAGR